MKLLAVTLAGLSLAVAAPARAQVPAAPSDLPTAAPPARAAFPADGRIAFVDIGRIAATSRDGRALAARVEELRSKKAAEVESRGKDVAALETRLTQSQAMLNDAAREQLRKQFERAQVDFQRFTQDAQTEVAQVQRELEQAFLQKAFPVIGAVAQEKKLWAVFALGEGGLVWREEALDISDEIARRLDATEP